jgi:glycosyltransferase involved in cell wall biosynthesis
MFAILIPAYKAKYLQQAIDSVLKQTYTDFELIIVNDNSPEDLDIIVNQFNDSRIRYFKNEVNLGGKNVVDNWNKCLSLTNSAYSLLFSDDDLLASDFLAEIATLINKYPQINVFYSRVNIIDLNNTVLRLTPSAPEHEDVLDFIWHRVSAYREIYAQNFVFKTNALKAIGGFVPFPLAWGTDDATWFTLAAEYGVVSTSKALCSWRWSELNISNVGKIDMRIEAVYI